MASSGAVVVIEETFLLIKPDAASAHRHVLAAIRNADLQVAMKSLRGLTRHQAEIVVSQYPYLQAMFHAEHLERLERDGELGHSSGGGLGRRSTVGSSLYNDGANRHHGHTNNVPSYQAYATNGPVTTGDLGNPASPTSTFYRRRVDLVGAEGRPPATRAAAVTAVINANSSMHIAVEEAMSTPSRNRRGHAANAVPAHTPRAPRGAAGASSSPRGLPSHQEDVGEPTAHNTTAAGGSSSSVPLASPRSQGVEFDALRPADDRDAVPFAYPQRLDLYGSSSVSGSPSPHRGGGMGIVGGFSRAARQLNASLEAHSLLNMNGSMGGANNSSTNPSSGPPAAVAAGETTFMANWLRSPARHQFTSNNADYLPSFAMEGGVGVGGGAGSSNPLASLAMLNGSASLQGFASVLNGGGGGNTNGGFGNHPYHGLTDPKGAVLTTAAPSTEAYTFRPKGPSPALAKAKAGGKWSPAECAYEEAVDYLVAGGTCLALVVSGVRAIAKVHELVSGGGPFWTKGECKRRAPSSLRALHAGGADDDVLCNGFFAPDRFVEAAALIYAVFGYETAPRSEVFKPRTFTKDDYELANYINNSANAHGGGGNGHHPSPSSKKFLPPLAGGATNGGAAMSTAKVREAKPLLDALDVDDDKYLGKLLQYFDTEAQQLRESRGGGGGGGGDGPSQRTTYHTPSSSGNRRRKLSSSSYGDGSSNSGSESDDDGGSTSDDDEGDSSDGSGSSSASGSDDDDEGGRGGRRVVPYPPRSGRSGGGGSIATTLTESHLLSDHRRRGRTSSFAGGTSGSSPSGGAYGGARGGGDRSRFSAAADSRELALERQQAAIQQIVQLLSEERRSIQLETRKLRVSELELLLKERRLRDVASSARSSAAAAASFHHHGHSSSLQHEQHHPYSTAASSMGTATPRRQFLTTAAGSASVSGGGYANDSFVNSSSLPPSPRR